METFANGAYVVIDGHTQYRNMGVEGYLRHLMVEFGPAEANNAVLTMFDRVDDHRINTYTWNANIGNAVADFSIVSSLGEDQGFPTFTLVAPNGGTMKGWVLWPAGAELALVPGDRLSVEKQGATEDFVIVMSLEPETTPALEVLDHGNAGSIVRLGNKTVAFDRRAGTLLQGEAATALALNHASPLSIRGLTARILSSGSVELRWLPFTTGAERLIVEQRGPSETEFTVIANIAASRTHYTATGLTPQTNYTWRITAVSGELQSDPSDTVQATTWEQGMALYVEDFAPRVNDQLPLQNAIGRWQFRNQDRGWQLQETLGSPRNAANPVGMMATAGRTRINFQNILFTEGFSADLSTTSAAVEVDIMTEGTVRFSLMLQLASGQWVRTNGEAHIASRTSWHRQRWAISSITAWNLFDMQTLNTGAAINLTAADLSDIRGIGIRAQWPLNERWARLDQLHLYAKDFVPAEAPPEGFTLWRMLNFGQDANNEAVAGFSANPAGDGIANGLRYAMGWGDPRQPVPSPWPAPVIVNDHMELTYTWDSTLTDVDLSLEVSYDLEIWHSGPEHLEEVSRFVDDGMHTITIRALQSGPVFMRMQATPR
ncbi:MAG: fibronectin type III domain-containing protein [Verrucomicrobia bacterium]|nr:fibronectin type III domain-containing protein [Verrucomicrobiota bacterium]